MLELRVGEEVELGRQFGGWLKVVSLRYPWFGQAVPGCSGEGLPVPKRDLVGLVKAAANYRSVARQ